MYKPSKQHKDVRRQKTLSSSHLKRQTKRSIVLCSSPTTVTMSMKRFTTTTTSAATTTSTPPERISTYLTTTSAPFIPEITPTSSFFHRGVKALYNTPNLAEKIDIIDQTRRLYRKRVIPLIHWPHDRDMYHYLHFGTTNPTEFPTKATLDTIGPHSLPIQHQFQQRDQQEQQRSQQLQIQLGHPQQPYIVPNRVLRKHGYHLPQSHDFEDYLWGDIVKNKLNTWIMPARPEKPQLQHRVVSAKDLGVPLNAYVLHTLAHIELNAVEMYLDTILRFGIVPSSLSSSSLSLSSSLPQTLPFTSHFQHPGQFTHRINFTRRHNYGPTNFTLGDNANTNNGNISNSSTYHRHQQQQQQNRYPLFDDGYNIQHPEFIDDLLSIVADESRHFKMCCDRLVELSESTGKDYRYGTQLSTFQLWVLGVNTRHDIAERLAVIPLSQEARGLDSTTRFVDRLYSAGDKKTASIVFLIGKEEERHVALGVKWFLYAAAARGIVTTNFCAEYDYCHLPLLDLQPSEQWDFKGNGVNTSNTNNNHNNATNKKQSKQKTNRPKEDKVEYDDSAYHSDNDDETNDNNIAADIIFDVGTFQCDNHEDKGHTNQNYARQLMVEDVVVTPLHIQQELEAMALQFNNFNSTTIPATIPPSQTNPDTTTATNNAYQTQVPIHVKQVSTEILTTPQEREDCQGLMRDYYQANVTDHLPDGMMPPFNRLARYASGMGQDWYVPLKTPDIPLHFVTVAPNAPIDAPIRKHFKRLIDKMYHDNGVSDQMK